MKQYQILETNESCVLLKRVGMDRYMVRDVENDIRYLGDNYDSALETFHSCDIRRDREARESQFHDWLRKNT